MLFALLLGTGSFVSAAGPGPNFSNVTASNSNPQAGDTVFLTTRITSTADILGNPTIAYLMPDGTPGPSVAFSRVGGSLRDGEWQATLPLSESLISGPYYVYEVRAADVAGNYTVTGLDEGVVHSADLNVTNTAQSSTVGATNGDESDLSAAKGTQSSSKPSFCNGNSPGLTFQWVYLFLETTRPNYDTTYGSRSSYSTDYRPSVKPGNTVYVLAYVRDCNPRANENNNGYAKMEYYSSTTSTQRTDGPQGNFSRVAGNEYDGLYVAKVTLFGYTPCECNRIRLKQLYMGDQSGGYTFTINQYGWFNDRYGTYSKS